jgi:ribokinase
MSNRSRVHVVGSLNEDLVLAVDNIPSPGETVPSTSMARNCGGKGANQAVAAARAGASVHMVGCVGTDEAGQRLLGALGEEGVDVSGVARVEGPSGLAVVAVAGDGENAIIVASGANGKCTPELVHSGLKNLRPGDVVVTQGEVPVTTIQAAADQAHAATAYFVLNLAPPIDLDPAHARVDLLVVNEHEAITIARKSGCTSELTDEIATHLCRVWQSSVVVTLGAAGALWTTPGTIERVPAAQAERVVDTTGAGDAFVGALAAALVLDNPLRTAVRWGLAAGAIAVSASGAQGGLASPERIARLVGASESLLGSDMPEVAGDGRL